MTASDPHLPTRWSDMPASVLSGFLQSVRAHPDVEAVVSTSVRLSYRQLAQRVAALARMIGPAVTEPGTVVGVAVDDPVLHLALLLAIEASGGASVSLERNTMQPHSRLKRICRCLVVDQPAAPVEGKTIIHLSPALLAESMNLDCARCRASPM